MGFFSSITSQQIKIDYLEIDAQIRSQQKKTINKSGQQLLYWQ